VHWMIRSGSNPGLAGHQPESTEFWYNFVDVLGARFVADVRPLDTSF